MKEKTIPYTVFLPKDLKLKVMDIAHKRKMKGKPNSTQKGVIVELLEAGIDSLGKGAK